MQPLTLLEKRVKHTESLFLGWTHKHKNCSVSYRKKVLLALGNFGMSGRLLRIVLAAEILSKADTKACHNTAQAVLYNSPVCSVSCCLAKKSYTLLSRPSS